MCVKKNFIVLVVFGLVSAAIALDKQEHMDNIMVEKNLNVVQYNILTNKLPLVIASDHAGAKLKLSLIKELKKHGINTIDLGSHEGEKVDYPDYAKKLTDTIKIGKSNYGILICSTGIGMSMAANREKHVRAALCTTEELAKLSRTHNNANVLVLGSKNTSEKRAINIMKQFFSTKFLLGKHKRRVKKMS